MANTTGNADQLVDEINRLDDKATALEMQVKELEEKIHSYELFLEAIEVDEKRIKRFIQADLMELRDWIKANL